MVDCTGLENRQAERPREFESHPLRHPLPLNRAPAHALPPHRSVDCEKSDTVAGRPGSQDGCCGALAAFGSVDRGLGVPDETLAGDVASLTDTPHVRLRTGVGARSSHRHWSSIRCMRPRLRLNSTSRRHVLHLPSFASLKHDSASVGF